VFFVNVKKRLTKKLYQLWSKIHYK